jgi:hypothetical protein
MYYKSQNTKLFTLISKMDDKFFYTYNRNARTYDSFNFWSLFDVEVLAI